MLACVGLWPDALTWTAVSSEQERMPKHTVMFAL